jgi:hypothetical protein
VPQSQPMIRRLTRFSLRALVIAVTALCFICGYFANWKHQRHRFLAETRRAIGVDKDLLAHVDQFKLFLMSVPAPGALRLIGEKGHHSIPIVVPESDVYNRRFNTGSHGPEILTTHPDFVRAKTLFPESAVFPFIIRLNHAANEYSEEVNVVDAATGRLVAGIADGDALNPSQFDLGPWHKKSSKK